MKKFSVSFYERNQVSVIVEADNEGEAIQKVQDLMEEGIDYGAKNVSIEYSDTQDVFTTFLIEN